MIKYIDLNTCISVNKTKSNTKAPSSLIKVIKQLSI